MALPVSRTPSSAPRLGFLDWARGVGAVIMLQGHVFDSFSQGAQRQEPAFVLSQFVGGMPPAIFLFLTGVTLSFLMDSQERRELSTWQKLKGIALRSRYLLMLAVLFRVQLWLFAMPNAPWTDLLKVDILNCMGVSVLLLSPLGLLGRVERVKWSLLAGVAVSVAAPLLTNADWSGIPELVRSYLMPSTVAFPLFPWAAFLAFGVGTGTMIRIVPTRDMGRLAQWWAIVGLVLVFGSQYLSNIPFSLYAKSEFWLDSPWLVLIKLGLALLLLAIAYLWNTHLSSGWSWVRQLGTTSLLIYWVHTELVYGRWLYELRGNLNTAQTAMLALTVILAMLGLSSLVTRWSQFRAWIAERGVAFAPTPTEGD
ncbi:MAG: heparan-alpha-glucosaminide N-acetyltransferase domain-containing protein [Acidobacteria bacterium]|nr:heparan-alpha-glucosaminide N-acetyltransferase domain-containing protein [Acidobacteriota bacterium]